MDIYCLRGRAKKNEDKKYTEGKQYPLPTPLYLPPDYSSENEGREGRMKIRKWDIKGKGKELYLLCYCALLES